MKKLVIGLCFLVFIAAAGQAEKAAGAEYRYGFRFGNLYPFNNNDTFVRTDTIMLMLELDTKRSKRLDSGFRFGYDAFAARSSAYNACYDLYQAGYGVRYYFDERLSPEKEFHSFKRYIMADGFISLASKNKDLDPSVVAPQSLFGAGLKVGAGLEYVFGPLSSGFVDIEYLAMDSKTSSGSVDLTVSGLVVAFGVRLAR